MAKISIGEIRSDVPVPDDCQSEFKFPTGGRPMQLLRYKIEQLEIGQSVAVKNKDGEIRRKFKDRVRQCATNAGKKLKRSHVVRWTSEDEVTIWRIE